MVNGGETRTIQFFPVYCNRWNTGDGATFQNGRLAFLHRELVRVLVIFREEGGLKYCRDWKRGERMLNEGCSP